MPTLEYRGPDLAAWQRDALESWRRGDTRGTYRGTLEVFTGGGKTLLALKAACEVAERTSNLRVAVVVPTQALQRQWVSEIERSTNLGASDIGRVGGSRQDDWGDRRVLVAVLNSAARKLPELCDGMDPDDLMLVVDECHRAGAPQFSRVLATPARYRLGLSATPEREELDDNGEPIAYNEQVLGRRLGEVVFSFDLRKAREVGWLPEYRIHHHAVELRESEHRDYDRLCRQVDDLADRLRAFGREPTQARNLARRSDELGGVAAAYVSATVKRKDLLYTAGERHRVVTKVLADCLQEDPGRRVLLFHERVQTAADLHAELGTVLSVRCGLEHSKLGVVARRRALTEFAGGTTPVLVSVKSLVEGINVPAADVGFSVASSSSVRQRVQSLGRVLRRRFDGGVKRADMHIVYVADTVDELIYAKEDWSDLTGGASNVYYRWPLGAEAPSAEDGPPRTPSPTEEMEWERLQQASTELPARWRGVLPQLEYRVDSRGTVLTPGGTVVSNAQGVAQMIGDFRGAPGGRFRVTPRHRMIIVFHAEHESTPLPYVIGRLHEPFVTLDQHGDAEVDVTRLQPGDQFRGLMDKSRGTYKLRQKLGGVIERRGGPRGSEFAVTGPSAGGRAENVERLLQAWRSSNSTGMTFYVNSCDHAWYLEAGVPKFLASVPGGFAWPSELHNSGGEENGQLAEQP